MDCDLLEVSGQMVLPLPSLDFSNLSRPRPGSGLRASHRLISSGSFEAVSLLPISITAQFFFRKATRMVAVADWLTDREVRCLEPKESRPMTVRWKPLVILSGLFLLVALIGVVAITLTLVPRSSQSFLSARIAHECRALRGGRD